jgi:hypothetical protein
MKLTAGDLSIRLKPPSLKPRAASERVRLFPS